MPPAATAQASPRPFSASTCSPPSEPVSRKRGHDRSDGATKQHPRRARPDTVLHFPPLLEPNQAAKPSLPTEDSSEATSSLPQDAAQLSSLPSGGMGLAAVQGGACNEKRISRQQLFHLPPGAPWTPLGAAQIFFGHSLGSERHKSACGRQ